MASRLAWRTALLAFFGLVAVVVLRAAFPQDLQRYPEACTPLEGDHVPATSERIERFRRMLRLRTVSYSEHTYERENLQALHTLLREEYPRVFNSPAIKVEYVAELSLLLTWRGTDTSLGAALLASHLDVVPVDAPERWEHPPFNATIHDGFIYARGTLDDKIGVIAILENIEDLLQRHGNDYRPKRTVLVAFGHDEEVAGLDGAAAVGRLLGERNEKVAFLLDEGLPISVGLVPLTSSDVALIGVAEKGYMNVEVSVTLDPAEAGHASRPPRGGQAIGILAKALANIDNNPVPPRMTTAVEEMFVHVAPLLPFYARVFACNLWLFTPLLEYFMTLDASTNSLIRTTMSITMINGGVKANMLPTSANATINVRLGPDDTSEGVLAHLRKVTGDERVKFRAYSVTESQKASPCHSFGFNVVEKSVRQVFPDVAVAPSLMVAATDTGSYAHLTENIFRFMPVKLTSRDIARIHGDNERISLEAFEKVLNFYRHIMDNAQHMDETRFSRHRAEEL